MYSSTMYPSRKELNLNKFFRLKKKLENKLELKESTTGQLELESKSLSRSLYPSSRGNKKISKNPGLISLPHLNRIKKKQKGIYVSSSLNNENIDDPSVLSVVQQSKIDRMIKIVAILKSEKNKLLNSLLQSDREKVMFQVDNVLLRKKLKKLQKSQELEKMNKSQYFERFNQITGIKINTIDVHFTLMEVKSFVNSFNCKKDYSKVKKIEKKVYSVQKFQKCSPKKEKKALKLPVYFKNKISPMEISIESPAQEENKINELFPFGYMKYTRPSKSKPCSPREGRNISFNWEIHRKSRSRNSSPLRIKSSV